jgi:hypothetical protein
MKLKNRDIIRLYSALNKLTSFEKITTVNNEVKVVTEYNKINSQTQLLVVININRLKELVTAIQELDTQVVKQISGGTGKIEPGTLEALELFDKRTEMENAETEVKLKKIKLSDLKLDENTYSASTLSDLDPILVYDDVGEDV